MLRSASCSRRWVTVFCMSVVGALELTRCSSRTICATTSSILPGEVAQGFVIADAGVLADGVLLAVNGQEHMAVAFNAAPACRFGQRGGGGHGRRCGGRGGGGGLGLRPGSKRCR